LVSTGKKVIDQCGFTAADIDDGSRATSNRLFYKGKLGLKVQAVPADCVRSFLCVDLFPMGVCIHNQQPRYWFTPKNDMSVAGDVG
jgi:hypothetical protein